jgi:hypothetical protein
MTEEHPVISSRPRRAAIIALTILATTCALIAGVSGQDPWIRWPALVVAIGSAAGSLAMSARKNSLAGWYAVTAGVLLYRVLTDLFVA